MVNPHDPKLESDDELDDQDLFQPQDSSGDEAEDPGEVDGDDDEDDDMTGRRVTRGSNGTAAARRNRNRFQTGMVLTTPRIIQTSVGQLFEDMDSGDIDLEPDYQRNVVWTEEKQSNLVSSLLSHFYIPPILLSAHPNSSSGHQYTCIDGKQRLSSIKLFMQNVIPVADANKQKFWYSDKGSRKRCLPPDVAKRFRRESVPVVIYENLTDAQEREMFQRVQMGVTLSPAEKLSALRTPWTIFFDQLAKRYMDSSRPGENLCHIVRANRSNDWLFMGQISMTILLHDKRPYLAFFQQVKNFVEKEAPPDASQKKEIHATLNRLLVLANDPEYNEPLLHQDITTSSGTSTKFQLSPVEFIHIAFMAWRHPTASFRELSDWSRSLRINVHKNHPGQVRYNNACATSLRKEIESFRPTGRGAGEGSSSNRPNKRPHEDDDEDYHPSRDTDRRRQGPGGGSSSTSSSRPSTSASASGSGNGITGRTTFYSGVTGGSSRGNGAAGASQAQTKAQGSASGPSTSTSTQRGSSQRPLFRGDRSSSPESHSQQPRSAAAVPAMHTGGGTGGACGPSAIQSGFAGVSTKRITPQNPYL